MKKAICCLLLFLSVYLNAKEARLFLGPDFAHVNLKLAEEAQTRNGILSGAYLGFQYQDGVYFHIFGKRSWGVLSPSFHMIDSVYEADFGYRFQFSKHSLTPIIGLGFHHINEYRKNNTDLLIKFRKTYVPVGFLFDAYITDWFRTGVNATLLYEVDSVAEVGGFSGSCWELTSKNDVVVEVPLRFKPFKKNNEHWDLLIVPYWQLFRTGRSTATNNGQNLGVGQERFRYLGVRASIEYIF